MSCIGWPRERDPQLHDTAARKLLIPGWAGRVTDADAAYLARELSRRPELRRLWQVRRFTRYRKRITPAVVKRMAAVWAEDDASGDEEQATASHEEGTGNDVTDTIPTQLVMSI